MAEPTIFAGPGVPLQPGQYANPADLRQKLRDTVANSLNSGTTVTVPASPGGPAAPGTPAAPGSGSVMSMMGPLGEWITAHPKIKDYQGNLDGWKAAVDAWRAQRPDMFGSLFDLFGLAHRHHGHFFGGTPTPTPTPTPPPTNVGGTPPPPPPLTSF